MIGILERLTKERINVSIETFLFGLNKTPMIKITLYRGSTMETSSRVRYCMPFKDFIKYHYVDKAFDDLLIHMEKEFELQENLEEEQLELEENLLRQLEKHS